MKASSIARFVFVGILSFSSSGFAAEEPRFSIGFNPFRLSTVKSSFKAADGSGSSVSVTSFDTLGLSGGIDSDPWIELGYKFRRFAGYAYPWLPDNRREIWLGAKLDDFIESGVVLGIRQQRFSEPQDLGEDIRTSKLSRTEFGLFYRQKFLLLEQTFEGKLRPSVIVGDAAYEDPAADRQVQGFSLQGELLWVWEVSGRTEIDTGIELVYEKLNRKQGAFSAGSSSGYEISINLLRTVFQM